MVKVFYGDCSLLFSSPHDALPEGFTAVPAGGSFAKMIENLEKYKLVAVLAEDAGAQLRTFMENFVPVDAAGGVAENGKGELLMIFRNGRWDLPKGHREEGEDFLGCAVREVLEETGIGCVLKDLVPIHVTFHFYRLNERWEMKRTAWFPMVARVGKPEPQTQEGITAVEWAKESSLADKAGTAFPSVREVLEVAGYL